MPDKLSAARENYLRAIFYIIQQNKVARVKDISKFLGIGASSVSEGLKPLSEKRIINYEPYGLITLTEEGEKLAKEIIYRREVIIYFLINMLGIEEESAKDNADKIIYNITPEVLDKFVNFVNFTRICRCKEPRWMKAFQVYSTTGMLGDKCKECIRYCQQRGITKPIYSSDEHNCCK